MGQLITCNIVPVNLYCSINVTVVSSCANVCLILTDLDSWVNLFLKSPLQWCTVLLHCYETQGHDTSERKTERPKTTWSDNIIHKYTLTIKDSRIEL